MDLAFLVGRWRGEGTLRGAPVTTRSEGASDADGTLRLDVETRRGGSVVHRERVVFRGAPDGTVAAATAPRPGVERSWEVRPEGGALVLRHPGFLWSVTPGSGDDYEETFDAVGADGAVTRIVALRHVRERTP